MQNDEKLKNERNMLFIDSLADFLASTESKSSEEVREELIVEGIDPDISTNRLIEYAHKCSMDANRQLISMYGPFRCYSAWEAWAWVAAIVILFVCLWGGTP